MASITCRSMMCVSDEHSEMRNVLTCICIQFFFMRVSYRYLFFFLLSSFVFYLGLFFLADLSRDECDKGAKIDYAGSFYFLNIYGCLNHIYLPNDRYESKHQHPTFQRFVGMNPILGWAWIFLSQNPSRWAILG